MDFAISQHRRNYCCGNKHFYDKEQEERKIMKKNMLRRNSSYTDILLYGILGIVLVVLILNVLPVNEQEQKKMGMRMAEFDMALATKLMDKNNDGVCDACGMPVDQCIEGGMMECSMAPGAKLGVLGSTHVHALFRVYDEGKMIDFSDPAYFVKSMFVHVEGEPDNMNGRRIHVHATGVPLSLLFDSLSMNMNKYRLFVNDKEASYEGYVPADGDLILLTTTNDTEKLKNELSSVQK